MKRRHPMIANGDGRIRRLWQAVVAGDVTKFGGLYDAYRVIGETHDEALRHVLSAWRRSGAEQAFNDVVVFARRLMAAGYGAMPRFLRGTGLALNPGVFSARILGTLPEEARLTFASGGIWEQRPDSAGNVQPWPLQDELWAVYQFAFGYRVEDGVLMRTVWRFDEDGERVLVSEFDVDDSDYITLMSGFGDEARKESWREYYQWVIDNESDPLNALRIESHKTPGVVEWVVVLRPVVRRGRPIAVELLGGKTDGARSFRSPDALPREVVTLLRAVPSTVPGTSEREWFAGNYSTVEELVDELGLSVVSRDGESCRVLLPVKSGQGAATPRTEALREAARAAMERLLVVENPRRWR